MTLLSEYGVLEYLSEHWEILHTQSRQWIIEDIGEFIRTRKVGMIIRDKKGIQSGHKMPCLSRKFEK